MKRRAHVLVLAMILTVGLLPGPASALTYTWSWAGQYTDVKPANRTFVHRPPNVQNGQQSVHELSARRDRRDRSKGRAEAARKARFDAVQTDRFRATFFGRFREADNDPPAKLKVYVHCVGELDDEWVLIGRKVVAASTNVDIMRRTISDEDCETHSVDGTMLQVLTGERGDRRRRTVYLKQAELQFGGAAVWTEDFTTP